jgi:hypothetical protein
MVAFYQTRLPAPQQHRGHRDVLRRSLYFLHEGGQATDPLVVATDNIGQPTKDLGFVDLAEAQECLDVDPVLLSGEQRLEDGQVRRRQNRHVRVQHRHPLCPRCDNGMQFVLRQEQIYRRGRADIAWTRPEESYLAIAQRALDVNPGPQDARRKRVEQQLRTGRIGADVQVDIARGPRLFDVIAERERTADRVGEAGPLQCLVDSHGPLEQKRRAHRRVKDLKVG